VIRPYETAVVIDGTLSDDTIQKEQEKLEEFFKSNSEFEKNDVWGKRPLAYTIKKKKIGHFVFFFYRAEGDIAAAFDKHVKLNEAVLRHQTTLRNLKNEAAREAFAARKEEIRVDKPEDEDGDLERD